MPEYQDHFPPTVNRPALAPVRLPYKLRGLINENNKGSANEILEAAAFALERVPAAPKPVTFADLEKLMRDAITTFRGLEDAAKQVPALQQQVTTLTQQVADARTAAKTAADAQAVAEKALADAQANAIPAADLTDGNALLDQLLPQPAAAPAVSQPAPAIVDGNAASNQ